LGARVKKKSKKELMSRKPVHKNVIPFTLVLGGGGARGLAHIGVLKALEKMGLVPSLIVGTSMGAVVGGMYAQLQDADAVEKRMKEFLGSAFFKRIGLEQFADTDTKSSRSVWERFATHLRKHYYISKSALGSGKFAQATLIESLRLLLEDVDIAGLPLRFAAVTSDLTTGEEHVCTSGSIITAVAASSAIPGVVAPIEVGKHLYIDGTVTGTIPVPAARSLSGNPIVAVDVRQSLGTFENPQRGFETVIRASSITSSKLNDMHLQKADIILRPNIGEISWNEFHCIHSCILEGERIVEHHSQRLTERLAGSRFKMILRKIASLYRLGRSD
jgi:NTE family protein